MSKAFDADRPLGRVDLVMVATLKAILDTGKVSRAADALGVTQPSVSQNLKRLRAYFGDELFVRAGNTLQPTPRALQLAPLAARLMRDVNLISQPPADFDPRVANREFILCMSDIAEFVVLPSLSAVFARDAPGCSIRTVRMPQSQLLQALQTGEVDLAGGALVGAHRSLRQQRTGDHEIGCLVSARGRWANAPLTRPGYAESRHVVVQRISDNVDAIAERLHRSGIHRSVALHVSNHFIAANVVADTDVVCTLPYHAAVRLAPMFPVKAQPMPFKLGKLSNRLLWHERFHKDPSHIWLRTLVERAYRDILE